MNDSKNLWNDKQKTTDQYSTTNSIDYPLYLQNVKNNLQQNLTNYHIDILNKEKQEDLDDQEQSGMFSIIITSYNIYSHRYQLITQTFLNQQTLSFIIKHIVTLNNKQVLIHDKLSINVALILVNKINNFMDNIQLIVDPISGKIYFQTKSFINQTSLSHLRKSISRQDCFYTQIIGYSLKMAQRYMELVLFLIGQISLQQLLKNPIIKKQFQFLSQSQKILNLLQKSISCFRLFSNQNDFQNSNEKFDKQQKQEDISYFHNKQWQNAQSDQNFSNKQQVSLKKQQQFQQQLKSHLYQNLEYFTPNIQSNLKLYCSQSLYSNIDMPLCISLFQKLCLDKMQRIQQRTYNKNIRQIGLQSQKKTQYAKRIITIIQIVQVQGKNENLEEQWRILSQGGFGIVQIGILRFKNLSISYNYNSSVIIRQQLVRKRDKVNKKCKIKRERRILQKFLDQTHPNITSFYISFQSQYENYLFLDFTPYMSLDLYLKKNPLSVSFGHKLLFILQAIQGLIFLHSRNIIHLDIKPGNMLIHKSLRVQLSDFGQAFVTDQDNMETHQHAYTIPYCAPEIFYQSPVLSQGADIYAIGVCLLKQVLDQNYIKTFFRKNFTYKLSKGQLDRYSISQKFEKSFLSPVFNIIQHISLLAVDQQTQKRPQLKWIRQILEMCSDFIVQLIY